MEDLITTYLFQYKTCPLPGVGSLSIGDRTASYVLGEKQMHPPLPYISFSPAERSADDFVKYIASQGRISSSEAQQKLEIYCSKLNSLDAYSELEIPYAGKFYVDVEGSLVFKQIHFAEAILPAINAEKVIHPESTHTILVGDKESNSALMTEFYNEPELEKKGRWWIWALVLFVIAVGTIVIYFNNDGNSLYGNVKKMPAGSGSPTYKIPD